MLISNLQLEDTGFQVPQSVSSYKCKVVGRETESYGLLLTRLEFYLLESSKTTALGNDACYHVATKEQYALLADTIASVLYINADSYNISIAKF